MKAPNLRPAFAAMASAPAESSPEQQLEHQFQTPMERTSPNFVALRRWIRINRPDLYERLPHDDLVAGLKILNAETGLSIQPFDKIEKTAPMILAALQAKGPVLAWCEHCGGGVTNFCRGAQPCPRGLSTTP